MGSAKRALSAIFAGLLLFFGGYYAGVSAAGSGLTVYMQDGEGGVVPASKLAARYFTEQLPLTDALDKEAGDPSAQEGSPGSSASAETASGAGASSETEDELPAAPAEAERPALGTGAEKESASDERAEGKININTASAEELQALPGIGQAKSAAIVAYREANGPFIELEELMAVKGIGEGIFGDIKDLIIL